MNDLLLTQQERADKIILEMGDALALLLEHCYGFSTPDGRDFCGHLITSMSGRALEKATDYRKDYFPTKSERADREFGQPHHGHSDSEGGEHD